MIQNVIIRITYIFLFFVGLLLVFVGRKPQQEDYLVLGKIIFTIGLLGLLLHNIDHKKN